MFKENEWLLASVKALKESLARIKEEQGQMQMHMERLGSKKLAETERSMLLKQGSEACPTYWQPREPSLPLW